MVSHIESRRLKWASSLAKEDSADPSWGCRLWVISLSSAMDGKRLDFAVAYSMALYMVS